MPAPTPSDTHNYFRSALFVGYSLVDRTFLLLADQVRAVLPESPGAPRRAATVLAITRDPDLEARCAQDLGLIEMPVPREERVAGARLFEIFLDRVVWAAGRERDDAVQHLLDERYADLDRPAADRALQGTLQQFLKTVPHEAKLSDGWRHVRAALERLGADERQV